MHKLTQTGAMLVLGLSLVGLPALVTAQNIVPQIPVVQTPVAPTPVTPSTPVPLPTGKPLCADLGETIPSGAASNGIKIVECQSSAGTLCMVGISIAGVALECTGVFVSTPTSAPPPNAPVQLPIPAP